MSLTPYTAERLKREIGWDRIVKDKEFWGEGEEREEFGVFRILPSGTGWPEIKIVCDPTFSSLEQVEFSCWDNYYFHEYEGGLDGAVGFVSALVRGDLLLWEEVDENGRCCAAGFFEPGASVEPSSRSGVFLRLIQFDREPTVKRISGRSKAST